MARRKFTGEGFRKAGFWSQLVLLGLIDWASVYGFLREDVPAYHYVGFVIMNVALLALTVVMWRWLRAQRSPPLGRSAARRGAR